MDNNKAVNFFKQINFLYGSCVLTYSENKNGIYEKCAKYVTNFANLQPFYIKEQNGFYIITGKDSATTVIDINVNDNKDNIYMNKECNKYCNMKVQTKKGYHYYFKYSANLHTATNSTGVNCINDGGNAFCEPCHYKDENGNKFAYKILNELPKDNILNELPKHIVEHYVANILGVKNNSKKYVIYRVPIYNDKCNTKKSPNILNMYTDTIDNLCTELSAKDLSYHFLINSEDDYILYADVDGFNKDINIFFCDIVKFLKEKYNIDTKLEDFCYTINNGKKGSYHITNNKLYGKALVQKQIFANFLINYPEYIFKINNINNITHRIIDTTVYGASWYRCANQSKGNGDKGKHIPKKGSIKETIIYFIANDAVNINNIIPATLTIPINNNILPNIPVKPTINDNILPNIPAKPTMPIQDVQLVEKKNESSKNNELNVLKLLISKCFKQYRYDDYSEWIQIGFALKNSLGCLGLDIFHYYSSKSSKYVKKDVDNVWNSFNVNKYDPNNKPITIASIYYKAKCDNRFEYDNIIHANSMFNNIAINEHDISEFIYFFKRQDFIWQKGILYMFNGKQWVYDESNKADYASRIIRQYMVTDVYHFLSDVIPQYNDDKIKAEKRRISLNQLKKINFKFNVTSTLKDLVINEFVNFDNNPYYLPFKNIIYDLKTGTFRDYCRTDYITQYINYDWREPADDELDAVNKLILQIMPNEERELYLTILATCLDGNNSPFFAMFQASGRNGKSFMNDFLRFALTDLLSIKASSTLLFQSAAKGSAPEVANLGNKRMVLFQELDDSKGNRLNNAFLKNATGGSEWSGRLCYSNVTTHKNCATIIIECNEKLQFQTPPDTAERDRMIYIHFPSYFTINKDEVNESNNIYMASEYYKSNEFKEKHKFALIKILLDVYKIYVSNNCKLIVPEVVKKRTSEFLQNSSGIMSWFRELYVEVVPDKEVVFLELSAVFAYFQHSEYYKNMDKKEKQSYGKIKFYGFFNENCFLKHNFVSEKKIKGKKYHNILLNWKLIDDCQFSDSDDELN